MTIGITIPVHGSEKRFELARRVLSYYATMELPGITLLPMPLIDPDREGAWGTDLSGVCVWDESAPVGERFNEGFHAFRDVHVDGVMIVGSDDLVAPAVFQQIVKDRPAYQEVTGLHFYNTETRLMLWDPKFLVGSGKYFSRKVLDRCGWRPYDPNSEKNVDKDPRKHLKPGERVALHAGVHDPLVLSIEVADNMTPWEVKTRNAYVVPNKHMVFEAMNDEDEYRWVV